MFRLTNVIVLMDLFWTFETFIKARRFLILALLLGLIGPMGCSGGGNGGGSAPPPGQGQAPPPIQPSVVVLNSEALNGVTIGTDSSVTLVQSSVSQTIDSGQIIVAGISPNTPHGLLRRVVSVEASGGDGLLHLTTEQASLDQVVRDGEFSMSIPLVAADGQPKDEHSPLGRELASITLGLNGDLGNAWGVNGDCTLRLAGDMNAIFTGGELKQLSVELTGSEQIDAVITFGAAVSKEWSLTKDRYLQPVQVVVPTSIGPVPVVVVPVLDVNLSVEGSVSGETTVALHQSAEIAARADLGNGPSLTATGSFSPEIREATGSPEVSAKLVLSPRVRFLLYGIAGPSVSIQPFIDGRWRPFDNPQWWKFDVGVKGEIALRLEILSKVFADASFSLPIWVKSFESASGGGSGSDLGGSTGGGTSGGGTGGATGGGNSGGGSGPSPTGIRLTNHVIISEESAGAAMSLVAHPDGTKVLAIFQGLDRRANVLTATLGTCNFRDKRIINAGTTVSSRDGFDAVLQSGEVHLYWFGEEDRILNEIRSSDGVNFRNHRTLAAWGGQTGIAADSFGGRILVGGADNSDRHLWFVTINPNGGGIIQEKSFPSDKSALRPALSADSFQNFVYAGEDGRLNVLVGDGSNYNPPLIFPNQSRTGVGASHFNSKVVIAFTSIISGRIALHIRQGDVIQEQEFDQFTAHAPELLSIGGNLYIAWVGLDDHLNFALVEGI